MSDRRSEMRRSNGCPGKRPQTRNATAIYRRRGKGVGWNRPGLATKPQWRAQSVGEARNNVGSDSHKLGGSCCGSAGCYAAIVSRMHDVRSAQGDERGDVCERSESNLRKTQSGDRRARLNYAPPEHESTRWSTIGIGVERGG